MKLKQMSPIYMRIPSGTTIAIVTLVLYALHLFVGGHNPAFALLATGVNLCVFLVFYGFGDILGLKLMAWMRARKLRKGKVLSGAEQQAESKLVEAIARSVMTSGTEEAALYDLCMASAASHRLFVEGVAESKNRTLEQIKTADVNVDLEVLTRQSAAVLFLIGTLARVSPYHRGLLQYNYDAIIKAAENESPTLVPSPSAKFTAAQRKNAALGFLASLKAVRLMAQKEPVQLAMQCMIMILDKPAKGMKDSAALLAGVEEIVTSKAKGEEDPLVTLIRRARAENKKRSGFLVTESTPREYEPRPDMWERPQTKKASSEQEGELPMDESEKKDDDIIH